MRLRPRNRAWLALATTALLWCDGSPRAVELRGAVVVAVDSARSLTLRLLDVTDSRIGGLAVLLSDSSDGQTKHVLIDGGEQPRTAVDALRRLGVSELTLVVLTHAHADHYGGLEAVLREVPVRALAYNGDSRTLASYRRLLRVADSSGAAVLVVQRESRDVTVVTGRDTLTLRLLAPPPLSGRRPNDFNNRSVGVFARYGEFTALVPGDAEHAELRGWARTHGAALDVNVLVASHHGSANANSTSRSTFWYRTVTPELLLVAANGRQHPFAEVLEYARARGIPVYCTSSHGSIAVRAARDGRWTIGSDRAIGCAPATERVPR